MNEKLLDTSILDSIKKPLGPSCIDTYFDDEIIMHINSIFTVLTDLGVGPSSGFSINDKETKWKNFVNSDRNLESIKTYMLLRVRLVFDPPSSSIVLEALKETIKELEWRITIQNSSKDIKE